MHRRNQRVGVCLAFVVSLCFAQSATALSKPFKSERANAARETYVHVVDLYETWHAAEQGQGYDAKAAQWRARLPAKEEEQADDAGRSGGD